jgi:hypothetical protein
LCFCQPPRCNNIKQDWLTGVGCLGTCYLPIHKQVSPTPVPPPLYHYHTGNAALKCTGGATGGFWRWFGLNTKQTQKPATARPVHLSSMCRICFQTSGNTTCARPQTVTHPTTSKKATHRPTCACECSITCPFQHSCRHPFVLLDHHPPNHLENPPPPHPHSPHLCI